MRNASQSILYVQYTRPAVYPPLERSAILFAEAGWAVCFLGIALDGDPAKLLLVRHPMIREKLRPMAGFSWRLRLRYASFIWWSIREILQQKPDLIYCSDIASYPVGVLATLFSSRRVVMHEHDPPHLQRGLVQAALGWLRKWLAGRAALCVLPQESRATDFAAETNAQRIVVAFNCPLLRELSEPSSWSGECGSGLVLWYHGSLSPRQFPPRILDALRAGPPSVKLRFAGYHTVSNPNFVEQLMRRAGELGLADRVEYIGALPDRPELLREASRADVGLVLFSSEFRDPMVGASNKPFDYLGCGLPILTNATSEWQAFFGCKGVSIGCIPEDVVDLTRAITWLHDNPAARVEMGQRGRRLIESEWNYEYQFGRVFKALGISEVQSSKFRFKALP